MAEQFFALTLERAIWLYLTGDLTAKGLVHTYFLIRCKPGWTVSIDFSEVCTGSKTRTEPGKLPMAKSTFYRAIAALSAEKKISWEPIGGLKITLSKDKEKSPKSNTKAVPKKLNSKQKQEEAYQLFVNSLAPNVQSQFQKFAEAAVERLRDRPALVQSWIIKNYQELWSEFEKSHNSNSTHVVEEIDFSDDPEVNQMLTQARDNPAQWVALASSNEERIKRRAFVEWARRTNQLWNETE